MTAEKNNEWIQHLAVIKKRYVTKNFFKDEQEKISLKRLFCCFDQTNILST